MRRRMAQLLSVVLSVAMLTGSVSVPVNAAETGDSSAYVAEETVLTGDEEMVVKSEEPETVTDDLNAVDDVIMSAEDTEENEETLYVEESALDAEENALATEEVLLESEGDLQEDTTFSLYVYENTTLNPDGVEFCLDHGPVEVEDPETNETTYYLGAAKDLFFLQGWIVGKFQKIQYSIGAEGTKKTLQMKNHKFYRYANYEDKEAGIRSSSEYNCYYIPKEEINDDVYIYITSRDRYENIPVEFNDNSTNHYMIKSVRDYLNSTNITPSAGTEGTSFLADEDGNYMIEIETEAGYEVKQASGSHGYFSTVRKNEENNTYEFNFNLANLENAAPDKVNIDVICTTIGQNICRINADPDGVVVIVTDLDGNTVNPASEGTPNSYTGRSTNTYLLSADATYKVHLECKQDYTFNNYGVCVNTLMEDAYTIKKEGAHVHTKTNTPYDFTLPSGNSEVWVNTDAKYSPVIKVGGEEILPVRGVYNVSYLDSVKFSLVKGSKTVDNPHLVVMNGNATIAICSGAEEFSFDNRCYGKTLTVYLFDVTDKAAGTVKLKVSTPVTSVTAKGIKAVGGVLTISPAIGTTASYPLSVNAGASVGDLGLIISPAEHGFISADIVEGKLVVSAAANQKYGQNATITLYDTKNTTVAPNSQNITNGTISVTTVAPAWAKSAPAASLVNASDVTLDLKATAPKGVELSDNFYVAVRLEGNAKTTIPTGAGLTVNDTVHYYRVSGGTIPAISINAFKKNNEETAVLGEGCGTSLNANVYLVLTSDGAAPVEGAEGNVIVTSAAKKVTVTTKDPYYADKISLKKGTTSLYAGQSGVKIADINLGTKTTYNTTAFWEVKSVVDANGKNASSKITFTTGEDAGKQATDTGIYAVVAKGTPAGKYKVTVKTKDGFYAPEASIDITVLTTIGALELTSTEVYNSSADTCYIYPQNGKAVSAKTILVAKDQSDVVIKSPKIKYEIGKKVAENTITSVAGLTVNNKGVISVAKTFVPSNDDSYVLRVKATDYQGNDCSDDLSIVFKSGNYGIKVFDAYAEAGVGFKKVTGETITADTNLYLYAEDGAGNPIIGRRLANGNIDPDDIIYYIDKIATMPAEYRMDGLVDPSKVTKAGTYKLTLSCVDGTTATVSIGITYDSGNENYREIRVKDDANGKYKIADNNVINIDQNKAAESTGKIAAPDDVISVSLCSVGSEYGVDSAYKFVEGSLSVKGAKIVESDARNQILKIVLTKPEATVTLTKKSTNATTKKQETKKFEWTIKNSALSKAKAPAASKVLVKNMDVSSYAQAVYADYAYDENNFMEITLKEPLKDSAGKVITYGGQLEVELSNYEGLSAVLDTDSAYYFVNKIGDNKYTAAVQIVMKKGSLPSKKVSFNINYKDDDGNYLTGTPTTVTVSPAAFKKSFALNSTQTMSLKDGYSIDLISKSVGVKGVTYTRLFNYNKGGKYNNFADLYKIDNNKLTVKDSAAHEALFAASNVDKNGNPLPMDGYVECKVTYESGEVAYFTSKITVKWGSAQIGKYTIEKNDVPAMSNANYYSFTLQDASKNEVEYKDIKLAGLKNDSPDITYLGEYGMGIIVLGVAGDLKAGTYKSTALAILDNSKCPRTGNDLTDADWNTFGVQVQIIVKVVP